MSVGPVIKLNEIKTAIKEILTEANIEGFYPLDLSHQMEARVQSIVLLNPEEHDIQASKLPAVAIWPSSKDIKPSSIGKDQLSVKREANWTINIAAVVFNAEIGEFDEDNADYDAEQLMENIEYVLRGNPTLNGTAIWQFPSRAAYYTVAAREETLYKIGLMSLDVKVFY